jgi:hypothetical protein
MFYGGRLLSHLCAEDNEVNDFIQLCRLNRNLAILIDSDMKSAKYTINATKMRVQREFAEHGFEWVTAGREIENYVPTGTLRTCVEKVAPGRGDAVSSERYKKAIPSLKKGGDTCVDKLKVAHAFTEHPADLSRYDLEDRITKLVEFIRRANG